jgi:hypothetical protein
MNNKTFLIKQIVNSPFKKCAITKTNYPMLLMIRFAEVDNAHEGYSMIPDCMYSKYKIADYIFCSDDILSKEIKKSKFPINFIQLIKEDIVINF